MGYGCFLKRDWLQLLTLIKIGNASRKSTFKILYADRYIIGTAKMNRYRIPEDENFEENAEKGVLKNFLQIKEKSIIEKIEEQELNRTELALLEI